MRGAILTAAALAAAACEPQSVTSADTPARLAAEEVAQALSGQIGQSQEGVGLTSVRVAGESVVTVFSLPTPGQGADPAVKRALSAGIAGSFGPQICAGAGIGELYDAGGELIIRVEGSDGVLVADVPADCA